MRSYIFRKLFIFCLVPAAIGQSALAGVQKFNRPVYDTSKVHGVWDRRSEFDKKDFPFFKGRGVTPAWKDFEPQNGQYNWSILEDSIKQAVRDDQCVYFQLNGTISSPEWIYECGVPKVKLRQVKEKPGKSEKKLESYITKPWPYPLDENYQRLFLRAITAVADRVAGWPEEWRERLIFVQVSTGTAGDEIPYKAEPIEKRYRINKGDWERHRIKYFNHFISVFQNQELQLYLLFNAVSEEQHSESYDLLNERVTYRGRKGGVLPRGYHLTGMGSQIAKIRPTSVDPKNEFMLSRAEMDQTWNNPQFQLNVSMNFYWSAINALHGGLAVWDISRTVFTMKNKENPDLPNIIPSFYFFNKYAGQIFPETAKDAFIAFHKGLDSSDTKQYPEKEFGKAGQKNRDRYIKICKQYEQFGARMDDVEGITKGQVHQRRNMKGFNDCGWDIPAGNYTRFITQIAPDTHDQAYWRIGGELTQMSERYSRFARGFYSEGNKNRIDLNVQDEYYLLKKGSIPTPIKVSLIYFDEGQGRFSMVYDSVSHPEKVAYTVKKRNTGKWVTKEVVLNDAAFNNRGQNKADISLINRDRHDDLFHMIELSKLK